MIRSAERCDFAKTAKSSAYLTNGNLRRLGGGNASLGAAIVSLAGTLLLFPRAEKQLSLYI